MKTKSCFILSVFGFCVFGFIMFNFTQGFAQTTDGELHGQPFQYLQEQIDDLQDQIDNIQQGLSAAFLATNGDVELSEIDVWVDVLSINLPAGDYVSNLTINALYHPGGLYDPLTHAAYESRYFDGDTDQEIPSSGMGGTVIGLLSHSHTWILNLFEPTNVVVRCRARTISDGITPINICNASWTVISVDDQTIWP